MRAVVQDARLSCSDRPHAACLPHIGPWKWVSYVLKETLALPYDATLPLFRPATED